MELRHVLPWLLHLLPVRFAASVILELARAFVVFLQPARPHRRLVLSVGARVRRSRGPYCGRFGRSFAGRF